jgi:hypothetical protein
MSSYAAWWGEKSMGPLNGTTTPPAFVCLFFVCHLTTWITYTHCRIIYDTYGTKRRTKTHVSIDNFVTVGVMNLVKHLKS